MTIDVQIVAARTGFASLRDAWNDLVVDDSQDLLGCDGTSTYEWFETIVDAFPEAAQARVVVARRQGRIVGLLPVIVGESSWLGSRLLVPTELYGGRNGLLLQQPDPAVLAALLTGLDQACPTWTCVQTTLVVDSAGGLALDDFCKSRSLRMVAGEAMPSPFFPVLDNPDEFLKGVAKDLRSRLKTSARKLSDLGVIRYHEYRDESQAHALLDAVLAVERQSWKHATGSAITNIPRQENFYRTLFPRALSAGILYAMVVSVDDQPVAYNFGLCRAGVFSSLKISQIESLTKLSPSHLLNLELINRLRSNGVRSYDCMGKPEAHKARWSNASRLYARRQILIFNPGLRGRLAFLAHQAQTRLAHLRARLKGSLQTPTQGADGEEQAP